MPKHAETRTVGYTATQMFDLVADVGRYPQFLPWCVAARVRSSTPTELVADLTIGFGPLRESFTSRVTLQRPDTPQSAGEVRVAYENGPFRYLNNRWGFAPQLLPDGHTKGCVVQFFVDFEFRSRILQATIGAVFNEAVRRMVNAFLKRARDMYGPPAAEPPPTGVAAA